MKPYANRRLTSNPDVGDIRTEGRKSSVGRLPDKKRGYNKSAKKKTTRRHLKRADKAKTNRRLIREDYGF